MESVVGVASAAPAGVATAPSDSFTVWFTNSRSGRNAYQPPATTTMARPISALRLRIVVLLNLLRERLALGEQWVAYDERYKLAAVEMVPISFVGSSRTSVSASRREIVGARRVPNCTRSLANNTSSVQSSATRTFFSRRGSLAR